MAKFSSPPAGPGPLAGERCCCALRLDVRVPHGYSRQGDLGSVHAARVQNLRWRLSFSRAAAGMSSGGAGGGRWGEGPTALRLPPSLQALAQDHPGDAAAKALRPLSPEPRAAPRLRPRKAAQGFEGEGLGPTPPATPSGKVSTVPTRLPPRTPPRTPPRQRGRGPRGPRGVGSAAADVARMPFLRRLVGGPRHQPRGG